MLGNRCNSANPAARIRRRLGKAGGGPAIARKGLGGRSGGPRTSDPGRVHYSAISLKSVLRNAYDVQGFQIDGPGWLPAETFAVDAIMPPDTTREQFRAMLRNLLAERFKLAVHRETRELPIYALAVARNGPKLKESADVPYDSSPPPPPSGPPKPGPDGFPPATEVAGHRGIFNAVSPVGDRYCLICQQQSMQDLASELASRYQRPVEDETGLTARYDFAVTFTPDEYWWRKAGPVQAETEPFPDFFAAIQAQLGLKLDSKKGPAEVVVVDHAEKTPTGN